MNDPHPYKPGFEFSTQQYRGWYPTGRCECGRDENHPIHTQELAERLHAAILALKPNLALPPLPADRTQAAAELLGVLTALTDDLLHSQDHKLITSSVNAYNQTLGHNDKETDQRPLYERFAERVRFTGLALAPVGGKGIVTLAAGCMLAAYEGMQLGAEFDPELAKTAPDRPIPETIRKQMNKRLFSAQQHMEKAREGVAMLAGYPDGQAPTEADGKVLKSDDERITQIIDMGGSIVIDYVFSTPDGPLRTRGQAVLDGIPELVGLTAEERAAAIVAMVEADLDRMEAQVLQAPPNKEG